eukprot:3548968-Pyramimonas_sp.AAC.1
MAVLAQARFARAVRMLQFLGAASPVAAALGRLTSWVSLGVFEEFADCALQQAVFGSAHTIAV